MLSDVSLVVLVQEFLYGMCYLIVSSAVCPMVLGYVISTFFSTLSKILELYLSSPLIKALMYEFVEKRSGRSWEQFIFAFNPKKANL